MDKEEFFSIFGRENMSWNKSGQKKKERRRKKNAAEQAKKEKMKLEEKELQEEYEGFEVPEEVASSFERMLRLFFPSRERPST